jgi:hypothetical protein
MSDEEIRELERRAASGDTAALVGLLHVRLRSGLAGHEPLGAAIRATYQRRRAKRGELAGEWVPHMLYDLVWKPDRSEWAACCDEIRLATSYVRHCRTRKHVTRLYEKLLAGDPVPAEVIRDARAHALNLNLGRNPPRLCPICGSRRFYVNLRGWPDCAACGGDLGKAQATALGEAEEAYESGDLGEFVRRATTWAHLMYGSIPEGEAAISEAEADEGSRLEGLRVMVFG